MQGRARRRLQYCQLLHRQSHLVMPKKMTSLLLQWTRCSWPRLMTTRPQGWSALRWTSMSTLMAGVSIETRFPTMWVLACLTRCYSVWAYLSGFPWSCPWVWSSSHPSLLCHRHLKKAFLAINRKFQHFSDSRCYLWVLGTGYWCPWVNLLVCWYQCQ